MSIRLREQQLGVEAGMSGIGILAAHSNSAAAAKLGNSLTYRGYITYQQKLSAKACADFNRALGLQETAMLWAYVGRCHRDFGEVTYAPSRAQRDSHMIEHSVM